MCFQLGNVLLELIYPYGYAGLGPDNWVDTTLITRSLARFSSLTFLSYLFPTGAFVCAWYVMTSPEISVDLVYTQVLSSPYVNTSEEPSMED